MKRKILQLLKPLKVIQLGPDGETPLEELPSGAEVRILRESRMGDCIDIAYENQRYVALKNDLLHRSEVRHVSKGLASSAVSPFRNDSLSQGLKVKHRGIRRHRTTKA
jgi:hypothetical protein